MSVLIKGMEMPRYCYECKVWFECFDEKPSFNMIKSVCPLVEVKTPHGRLIDVDRLSNQKYENIWTNRLVIDADDLDDASTIIGEE